MNLYILKTPESAILLMRSTSISSDVKLLFAAFLILVFTRADGQSNSILNFKVGSIIHREQYNGNGKLELRTIETILRCDTTAEGFAAGDDSMILGKAKNAGDVSKVGFAISVQKRTTSVNCGHFQLAPIGVVHQIPTFQLV